MVNPELRRFGIDGRPNILSLQPTAHKELLIEDGDLPCRSDSA
jgi:hypothetical protein